MQCESDLGPMQHPVFNEVNDVDGALAGAVEGAVAARW